MNERIRELAHEAGLPTYNPEGAPTKLEKFAELIVRECADVILNNDIEKLDDYGFNHPYFGGWERGVIDSAQIIKKHFGVEE